jgi:hypothetical protein
LLDPIVSLTFLMQSNKEDGSIEDVNIVAESRRKFAARLNDASVFVALRLPTAMRKRKLNGRVDRIYSAPRLSGHYAT